MKVTSWILGVVTVAFALVTVVRMPEMFHATAEAAAADPQQAEVTINEFQFTPAEITVAPGTTVHWVNKDDIPHNVISKDSSFKSQKLNTNQDFSYTFTKAGEYDYVCSIHRGMVGKVVVK
jgi:plastocyanin